MGIKMKVYVLDCGKQEVDKRVILSSAAIADADHHHPEAIWTWIPTWAILIDHPELGYVLYDTAISPDAMRGRWDIGMQKSGPYIVQEDSTLPARLYQLHIEPEQIRFVIMSHLHNDHAGCLHLFKNATVYVHDDELKHAMKHYMTRKELPPYCWLDLDLACRAELNWKTIKNEDGEIIDLARDLHIVNFGSGHAHGMLGLILDTKKSKPKFVISDILYSSENEGPPLTLPGIVYDTVGYRRSVRQYQRLKKMYDMEVWYGHDIKQWEKLVKSQNGYYE